ncbi:unnamed protein product [Gongylonema pulchrum]|uniref:Uncharacterized protein n=1 Tax=Gongylonema pulchrum TaxID=637853 RepID=A0A183ER81_9BILA|nr:unnamed protein product [Gongylonema pulchrum]
MNASTYLQRQLRNTSSRLVIDEGEPFHLVMNNDDELALRYGQRSMRWRNLPTGPQRRTRYEPRSHRGTSSSAWTSMDGHRRRSGPNFYDDMFVLAGLESRSEEGPAHYL